MTIACTWPRDTFATYNPYLFLFHTALTRNGVTFDGGVEINNDWLKERRGRLDAIILHWGIDHFWRGRGTSRLAVCRAMIGLWRYFRAARRQGVRVVWVVHDLQPHERWSASDRIGYRLLARASDVCLLHSEQSRLTFAARYPSAAGKTMVFPIGNYDGFYPPASSNPRARFGLPTTSRILLCPGLLRPYKGYETAIDAMKYLSTEYTLVVAGPPSVPSYVDELRRRAGDRANIILLPKILDDQEYADIHAAADCVLLPYRKITGSSALMAAVTLGRGVVASQLPYFQEMLAQDPVAGVMHTPDDPAALAKAVQEFFTVPVEVRSLAARKLADRYPWDKCIEPLVSYFRNDTLKNGRNA